MWQNEDLSLKEVIEGVFFLLRKKNQKHFHSVLM